MSKMILNPNCSEVAWRLGDVENTTWTDSWPTETLRQMVDILKNNPDARLTGVMNTDEGGGGGDEDYILKAFDVAKRVFSLKLPNDVLMKIDDRIGENRPYDDIINEYIRTTKTPKQMINLRGQTIVRGHGRRVRKGYTKVRRHVRNLNPSCSEAVFRFHTKNAVVMQAILQATANITYEKKIIPQRSAEGYNGMTWGAVNHDAEVIVEPNSFVLRVGNNNLTDTDGAWAEEIKKICSAHKIKIEEAEVDGNYQTYPKLDTLRRDCTCGITFFKDYIKGFTTVKAHRRRLTNLRGQTVVRTHKRRL